MHPCEVYVYGMTVLSTIHKLRAGFPAPDGYQEIEQTYVMPGGEGANCALVLRHWGVSTRLDGCYLGTLTAGPLQQYFTERQVDCSGLERAADFEGWRDLVFCDGASRTVFGWFVKNLFGGRRLWAPPSEAAIQAARCVALDPFFGAESEQAAELCRRLGVDYVTLDCHWETAVAQHARVLVCSREFLDREYPGADYGELLERYRAHCAGLVIFTFGSQALRYVSPGDATPRSVAPFTVPVVDTLGAGDTFRAGVVYGLLQGLAADALVRFAAASAAVCCTRFPSVLQPPELAEIEALLNPGPGAARA